ncbi:Myb-like DNA-binding domain protein [Podila clonocystis]|nr:Myb-like DNA-binding domain protein [Podila clonocystis]
MFASFHIPGSGSILRASHQWINRSKSSLFSSWPTLSTTLPKRHYIASTPTLLQNTEQQASTPKGQRLSALVRWSKEEDELIFEHVRDGYRSHEIYNLFPRRNQNSVAIRITRIRAAALAEQQKHNALLPMTGQKKEEPKVGKADSPNDSNEGREKKDQMPLVYKRVREARPAIHLPSPPQLATRRVWTIEDDELLQKLVAQYSDESIENRWLKIATTVVNPATGATIARTATSCKRRWAILDPTRKRNVGTWSKEETAKLAKAVRAQVGNQFRAEVGLLDGDAKEDGTRALVLDGPELTTLDWGKIEGVVGTRTDVQCRSHFYRFMHTASKGPWGNDEIAKLKEAVAEHGKDWHKVAKAMGTRIPAQVQRHYTYYSCLNDKDDAETEE